MNFTAIFCCYVLLPYFGSIVSPPQKVITCIADGSASWLKFVSRLLPKTNKKIEVSSGVLPVDEKLFTPNMYLKDRYFVQNRNHYRASDLNLWSQRYLVYGNHYGGNGVIFIKIGTDVDITSWSMQNGRWFKLCRAAKALCVGIERRGYGQSLNHIELNGENIKYVNVDQALADVAWFIFNFRDLKIHYKLPEKLKFVVYGKGKQGTLAVWLRMKYPHLVDATLSLSAPVLAKEEFEEYFKLIDTEMLDKEKDFKDQIKKAYEEIQKEIDEENYTELGRLFKFCDVNSLGDLKNGEKNTKFMYFIFAQTLATIMQYGNDDMELIKKKAIDIMLATTEEYERLGSPIYRFAHLIKEMLVNFNKRCLQINHIDAMRGYRSVTGSGDHQNLDYLLPQIFGTRAYIYQSCYEFGLFQTFENFFDTSIDLMFYIDICRFVFGKRYSKEKLERGVRRTNLYYGGFSIVVSHVIFVYGSNDPYKKLGMTDHLPEKSVVRFLEGASYCHEIDIVKDYPGLSDLKDGILVQLLDWLQVRVNDENVEGDHENSDSCIFRRWAKNCLPDNGL